MKKEEKTCQLRSYVQWTHSIRARTNQVREAHEVGRHAE